MQILKVLLVVLLVVNLTTGFFFKKKKKVYVHHPAPAHPQYTAPYPYTYSHYYQPAPYYHYAPVHAAPAAPSVPAAPVAPAPPAAPAVVPIPAAPPAPVPSTDSSPVTHLSSKQALPVFEPASFNTGASKNVEIVPSLGFQMGTKTDFIEIYKSEGKYIELPSETVPIDDVDSIAPIVPSAIPNVAGGVTTLIHLNSAVPEKSDPLPILVPNAETTVIDSTGNAPAIRIDAEDAEPITIDEKVEVPPQSVEITEAISSAPLIETVVEDEISTTEAAIAAVSNDAPPSNVVLLNTGDSVQVSPSAETGELGSTPLDVLQFPEVQQLLNELIKNEEFDGKRFNVGTITDGDLQSSKTVEIDPQVSYSRVVRQ
ncbi:calphotin-like [Anopheles moucheti]|uniref:calphotin-like n=1 Tax=Anopheles moucheti TaxID=186751 RepID=UPI0022F13491|nr:calphotin-like [Anopheles moucheti]